MIQLCTTGPPREKQGLLEFVRGTWIVKNNLLLLLEAILSYTYSKFEEMSPAIWIRVIKITYAADWVQLHSDSALFKQKKIVIKKFNSLYYLSLLQCIDEIVHEQVFHFQMLFHSTVCEQSSWAVQMYSNTFGRIDGGG